MVLDDIWFPRNKVLHEVVKPNLSAFVSSIKRIFKEHCHAWGNIQINFSKSLGPLSMDHRILTFDVVVRQRGSTTVAICRTPAGSILFVITKHFCSTNPNQGEATTMLLGVQEAKESQIEKLVIVGDSLTTLKVVQDSNYVPDWSVQPLIQDIRITLKGFHRWEL